MPRLPRDAARLDPSHLRFAVLAILCGAATLVAFGILVHSTAFWLGNVEALARTANEFAVAFSTYPEPIFGGGLKLVLLVLVPAALIGWFPVDVVRGFSWASLGASALGAALYVVVAVAVFRLSLRRYESGNRIGPAT